MALFINYQYQICFENINSVTHKLFWSINFNNRHWK